MSSAGAPLALPDVVFDLEFGDVLDSSYWEVTTSFLSTSLRLPDLSTRRGLKRVHKRFKDIYEQLHHVYTSARQRRFPLVMATIVGLMTKMSADDILREKLFERGLLQNVLSLLEYEDTRSISLETLLAFTYYKGRPSNAIPRELASQHRALSNLINVHSHDPRAIEVAVSILAHATISALDAFRLPNSPIPQEILFLPTHPFVISALRNPANHRSGLLTHALQLLISPIECFPEACQRVPSLPSLLVSFLRSKDISTRALALVRIFNLSRVSAEPDQQNLQLGDLRNALCGTVPQPQAFADLSREEFLQSLSNSHAMNLYRGSTEHLNAMAKAAHDHDFYTLGHTLSNLFQRSQSAVEGSWKEFEEEVGVPISPTSPFTLCSDTLPECARALREKGAPSDLAAADIIEMKFLIVRGRLGEAIVHASRVLEREPRMSFAYYVIGLGKHLEDSFSAAREGLRCPDVTPFLREHLLWRSIDLATRKALTIMVQTTTEGEVSSRRQESLSLLLSAMEDAETFVQDMPCDTPLLLTVLGWIVLLTVVLRGHQLGANLRELQTVLKKITKTEEVMRYFGCSINKTEVYVAWSQIVETFASSSAEWGDLVQSYDALEARIGHCEIRYCYPLSPSSRPGDLAHCSGCGCSSAVLRKCNGCEETWYCDTQCQRSHWGEHKAECQRRRGGL
ncbi:hypothetical protein LXA43DRAFT_1064643 [Ganoderma leucocontextum]|nr:hypothetical protein LXA43DRAFT_1064643 [Ganoderma leucocontextum]